MNRPTLGLSYDGSTDVYKTGRQQAVCRIATGSYTGDGATSLAITGVGFRPKYVRIWDRHTVTGGTMVITETTDTIIDDHASGMAVQISLAALSKQDAIISLDSDGFTVDDAGADDHPNKSGTVYNYLCLG